MTHAHPPQLPAIRRPAGKPYQIHTNSIPKAGGTVTLILSGKSLGTDGVTYLYSGTVQITPQGVIPPPPPPLALTSYSPNPSPAGGPVTLTGTGFASGITATYLGLPLAVTYLSATRLTVTAPVLAAGGTGPVTLALGTARVTGPILTVLPGQKAPDLFVTGYRDGQRNPATSFLPGATVFIDGANFGTVPGTVKINGVLVPTQKWTDTELEIVAPPPATGAETRAVLLDIRRPDGGWETLMGFVLVVPPGAPRGKVRF